MSEPPPSPLETSAPSPPNDQTSNSPCRPSLGSHRACENWNGVRGNEPGGHFLPRSSRHTSSFACASRYAMTDPPKPDPTMTASKLSPLGRLAGIGGPTRGPPPQRPPAL